MIQFNLLPDVKLEYIKARQSKRLVMISSAIVTGVSIGLVVVLFLGVNVVQKNHLSNLASDIERDSQKLEEEKDLDKILTVQNQLNSLNDLHAKKPAVERLSPYLTKIVPKRVSISLLEVDFSQNTMSFEGSSTALRDVNQFIDTMKFTEITVDEETKKAFSSVVLASFDRNDGENRLDNPRPAKYTITLQFDPIIFDNVSDVKFKVPDTITTQSAIQKPDDIFQVQVEGTEGEE